jgi:hypothetical protein
MSMDKYNTDDTFPFSKLYLGNPNGLQGGSYFSKIKLDSNSGVLLQMPKCFTKDGIHKTGKKIYTDLLFDTTNEDFEQWTETLTDTVKNLIFEKKDMWFQDDLTFDDIEYAWQEMLRTYKKKNFLFRCFIKKPKNISRDELVMVYDEYENNLSLDDITDKTEIIPLIQLNGLKFTTHSFSLEFNLKQVMILKNVTQKHLISYTMDGSKSLEKNNTSAGMKSEEREKIDEIIKTKEIIENDVQKLNNANDKGTGDVNVITDSATRVVESIDVIDDKSDNLIDNVELGTGSIDGVTETSDDIVGDLDCGESTDNINDKENNNNPSKAENQFGDNNTLENVNDKNEQCSDNLNEKNNNEIPIIDSIEKDTITNKFSKTDINNLEKIHGSEEMENIRKKTNTLEKNSIYGLNEVDLDCPDGENAINLRDPEEVYISIYNEAKRRAKEAKRLAIEAVLELKRVKNKYMLDEFESSDDEFELNE